MSSLGKFGGYRFFGRSKIINQTVKSLLANLREYYIKRCKLLQKEPVSTLK